MSALVAHTMASSLTLLRDPMAPCPFIQPLTDQLTPAICSHLCLLSVPMSPSEDVSGAWAALAASTSSSQAVAGEGIDIW